LKANNLLTAADHFLLRWHMGFPIDLPLISIIDAEICNKLVVLQNETGQVGFFILKQQRVITYPIFEHGSGLWTHLPSHTATIIDQCFVPPWDQE